MAYRQDPANLGTVTQFDVLVGGSGGAIGSVGPGSAGQALLSGGNAANPAYSTPTYPSASGTSGKILISDGTNNVYSTPTFPNASATSGKLIISDGTNWIASTPTFPNSASGTGTLLRADGTNWVATTSTYPNTNAINTLLYASSANVMSALATANSGILATNSSGVPAITTASGNWNNTSRTCLTAVLSGSTTNQTGDATAYTIVWNQVTSPGFDQGSNMNTGTGVFTAPVTGRYLFCVNVTTNGTVTAVTDGILQIVVAGTSGQTYNLNRNLPKNNNGSTYSGSAIVTMTGSDTATIVLQLSGTTKTIGAGGGAGNPSTLSITLIA